jgi:hypothetical protein
MEQTMATVRVVEGPLEPSLDARRRWVRAMGLKEGERDAAAGGIEKERGMSSVTAGR